ncbi:MAG: rhodanese-like domain-containing protein [Burkholderia sp.]
MSHVTEIPAADSAAALERFSASLRFETDCWDVHHAIESGPTDFVLLDVRSPEQFAAGHIRGAINLPHRKIVEGKLSDFPIGSIFVTYCAGPHCNGATRAAIRLARLERPVKLMPGGITGWRDEGFELVTD